MDSLDAQCYLIQLTETRIRPPDLWRHERSGALSCTYVGSETTFTWPPEDVAEIARRWRASDTSAVPEPARLFLEANQRLEALVREAGLAPADLMIHDLAHAEIRATWNDEQVVLVVEAIGEGPPPPA